MLTRKQILELYNLTMTTLRDNEKSLGIPEGRIRYGLPNSKAAIYMYDEKLFEIWYREKFLTRNTKRGRKFAKESK